MYEVDDTAPAPSESRELSQDVQALINNGLDFLDKAREELETSKPKFSVVSFWTAVEILLKVPLAHEHWSLVCSPKKPIKKQAYLAGDFQSVTYEETRERLKDVLEKPLDKETDAAFDKVRKHRNRVVHFYHPTFTAAEQNQILKEQADAWFALNRLLRDEWKVIFGAKHNWKLAFGETRLIRGNEFYAEVRLKQVKPELEQLAERNIQIGTCTECHQHAMIIETETMGNENRKLEVTRCKVCTSAVRQITLVCPYCEKPQVLPEGDGDFGCKHCDYTSGRYELLDEETFHSADEQMLSVFPAGCTNCMAPESVCKFGDGYLCTQCFLYYNDLHVCNCCDHLSDTVPELSYIRGCEFCDGDQRYLDD
ncbi:hsdR [Yersinia enterocolitica]|nr:hsdR [Yersinia enterocolitica]EKN4924150.1 hsdR [Yersinia enterocolitica]EKN5956451.1 hsdR [Yersinia enterocolitica]